MESMDSTLKKAKDAGIVVITHEGADLKNVDYDIEAFSNEGYGAFIMQNLAEAMGEEGVYTTMVASLQMVLIMNGQMQPLNTRKSIIRT